MIQHPDEDRAAARGQLGDHILIRSWRCGLRRLRPLPASADARYYRSELVSWKRIDRESPLAYVFPTEFANPGLVAGTPADLRPVKDCAVTKRRDAFSLRAAWSGRAPEHLSQILANFESGLSSGWLPHKWHRSSIGSSAWTTRDVLACCPASKIAGPLLEDGAASRNFARTFGGFRRKMACPIR